MRALKDFILRHACSHFSVLSLLIRSVQRYEFNQEIVEHSFPENSLKLRNHVTLIEHAEFSEK